MHLWQDLTTEDFAVLPPNTVAVLPLAAVEQHGPHLPLSVDLDINRALLTQASALLPNEMSVLLLPELPCGTSQEHSAYAGTLSLQAETLIAAIVQLGQAVARAGVKRLLIFNTHGGNPPAIDIAALRLRETLGLLVVKADIFRLPLPPDHGLPDAELRHGLHGGAIETSLMLHFRPEVVRKDRMICATSRGEALANTHRHLEPEGTARFAWLTQDLHPSGAVGDATLATAELGQRIAEVQARALADIVVDTAQFDLSRLVSR